MIRSLRVALTAFVMAVAAFAAQAVTYSNISGVVYENEVEPGSPVADHVLGDFGTNPNNHILEIVGDTAIYGGLVHANTARNQYLDGWSMDFGADRYNVAFAWRGLTGGSLQPFDGSLTVNGVRYDLGQSGVLGFRNLTGRVSFLFNPIHGASTPREHGRFTMTATAVPIPASILLMMSGVVVLGWRRRARA